MKNQTKDSAAPAKPQAQPQTIEALEAVLSGASEELKATQNELASWGDAYREAGTNGDPQRMIELEAHRALLEKTIPVLRVKELRASVAVKEARIEAGQSERATIRAQVQTTEERLKDAQDAHNRAVFELSSIEGDLRFLANDAAAQKREIERLVNEATRPALPVVRTWQPVNM